MVPKRGYFSPQHEILKKEPVTCHDRLPQVEKRQACSAVASIDNPGWLFRSAVPVLDEDRLKLGGVLRSPHHATPGRARRNSLTPRRGCFSIASVTSRVGPEVAPERLQFR
jgi:hypothetical protein